MMGGFIAGVSILIPFMFYATVIFFAFSVYEAWDKRQKRRRRIKVQMKKGERLREENFKKLQAAVKLDAYIKDLTKEKKEPIRKVCGVFAGTEAQKLWRA